MTIHEDLAMNLLNVDHPSILRIKNYLKEKNFAFSFEFVDKPKIKKKKLARKKAFQEHHIPRKLIKLNKYLFFLILYATISITPCSVLIF